MLEFKISGNLAGLSLTRYALVTNLITICLLKTFPVFGVSPASGRYNPVRISFMASLHVSLHLAHDPISSRCPGKLSPVFTLSRTAILA